MPRPGRFAGEVVRHDEPVWGPLLQAVGADLVGGFVWMFAVELEDGVRVQAYRHRDTSAYLYLDGEGGAYRYAPQSAYVEVPLDRAIEIALEHWHGLGATSGDLAAVQAAVERARDRRGRPR